MPSVDLGISVTQSPPDASPKQRIGCAAHLYRPELNTPGGASSHSERLSAVISCRGEQATAVSFHRSARRAGSVDRDRKPHRRTGAAYCPRCATPLWLSPAQRTCAFSFPYSSITVCFESASMELRRRRFDVPLRVKNSPADDVLYAAEVPQKADQIVAARRTENVCQETFVLVARWRSPMPRSVCVSP